MGDYYGVDSLDRETYIQIMQVRLAGNLVTFGKQWILDHLTIAKLRDNFKPSNQVLSNIEGYIDSSVGINLATGEKKSSIGTARIDLDALTSTLQAEGHININKDQTSVGVKGILLGQFVGVKGKFKSKKICSDNYCYQLTAEPYAGIGLGIHGGIGYNRNAEKKDTLTLEAGLGVVSMFGAAVTIEKEPNLLSIDNASENLPKPPL